MVSQNLKNGLEIDFGQKNLDQIFFVTFLTHLSLGVVFFFTILVYTIVLKLLYLILTKDESFDFSMMSKDQA